MTSMQARENHASAHLAELTYRDALVSEIDAALKAEERGGHVDAEWLSDRIDALEFSNRRLALIRERDPASHEAAAV